MGGWLGLQVTLRVQTWEPPDFNNDSEEEKSRTLQQWNLLRNCLTFLEDGINLSVAV